MTIPEAQGRAQIDELLAVAGWQVQRGVEAQSEKYGKGLLDIPPANLKRAERLRQAILKRAFEGGSCRRTRATSRRVRRWSGSELSERRPRRRAPGAATRSEGLVPTRDCSAKTLSAGGWGKASGRLTCLDLYGCL
jgi:hypothetical protein